MKQIVDFETWPRARHFKAFSQMSNPHFSLCFNVNITSYIPWMIFTGISEPRFDKNDSIPRVTWGKANANGEIPVSVLAHHGLMDGYHIGLFYQGLNERIHHFG